MFSQSKLGFFSKGEKKGGSGAYNWGSADVREDFENLENQEPWEEEGNNDDNTLTFDEYFQKNGQSEIRQQTNEAKSKISNDQLLQAIGKATPLQSRKDRGTDDYPESQGKRRGENHKVSLKKDHSNLLGIGSDIPSSETQKDQKGKRPQETKVISY